MSENINNLRKTLENIVLCGERQLNDDRSQAYIEISKDDIRRARKVLKAVRDEVESYEIVGKIVMNQSGQILIESGNGDYFDMSKYVGHDLHIKRGLSLGINNENIS